MIKRQFYGFEGSIAIGFSHSDFGLVVQALDNTAGERLLSAKVIERNYSGSLSRQGIDNAMFKHADERVKHIAPLLA